jgi:hypothetical protein
MILVNYDMITEGKAFVRRRYYRPEELPQEEIDKGVMVESIPAPEIIAGKNEVLYINPTTLEMWYEYVDRPLTQDEEMAQIKGQVLEMQDAINFLLGL